MKKMMIALVAMLTIAATGKAMSYEQARNEALFLTDKMAYELNLTDAQYEAAFEINLDYLMGVTSYLLGASQSGSELYPAGLAVERLLCSHLFLSPTLLA